MSIEEFNDDMHKLIVDRLKERNRKLEFIKGCETQKKGHTFSIAAILVAACLIGVLFNFSINNKHDAVYDAPFRSSMPSVQKLIEEERYEEAITIIEKELYSADSTLNLLKKSKTNKDEETLYEIQVLELKIKVLSKERNYLRKKTK